MIRPNRLSRKAETGTDENMTPNKPGFACGKLTQ